MDPGLAIVITALVVLGAALVRMGYMRRVARAQIEALRSAERLEIEIVSANRVSLVVAAIVLPIIFAVPFGAMALGSFGRAHAAELAIGLILVVFIAVVAPLHARLAWTRVGRVTLDRETLVLEHAGQRVEISLAGGWSLSEAIVPPGESTEAVMMVAQGDARTVLRYPLLLGEERFIEGLPVVTPSGTLLGPEARALHERLRALAGASRS